MKKRNFWCIPAIMATMTAMLLAIAIPITSFYSTMINAALGAETQTQKSLMSRRVDKVDKVDE